MQLTRKMAMTTLKHMHNTWRLLTISWQPSNVCTYRYYHYKFVFLASHNILTFLLISIHLHCIHS